MLTWKEKEPGFWVGEVDGKAVCKISAHFTGTWLDWLDGSEIPTVCRSVKAAKEKAASDLDRFKAA